MNTSVAIITQDEPFYMPLFFQEFFPRIDDTVSVERVSVLDVLDESFPSFLYRMYGLYGPTNFFRRGIAYLYRKGLNATGHGLYSVESVAERDGTPVESRDEINTAEYINWVKTEDIDIVLSVSAPQIFDEELLDAPNWGCINVHTADLPKYRGMLPTFWALYHDEDEIGVTVHTMEPEIDRGQIVRQDHFPITESTTLDGAITRGKREGGRTAAEAINDISAENVSLREMDGEGSYFSFPTTAERREFQRRGRELL
ncbi:formyltransferase family protein [Halovenus salina]|uniref:Formyltransferase family protein n=1 Tax=Halovenus salina TaxID=1510225 RepID=A0ABD5W1S9_9EURY|nr:formyltransferase family protein [Halovenus salina]